MTIAAFLHALLSQLRAMLDSHESRIVNAFKGRNGSSQQLTMQRAYSKMGGQTLRLFLSSTFRDMNDERDIFLKRYVPALRQHCSELGLFLSIVDLRWGVTVEQAQSGEVVPICMSEVEACQYFACFLGARYGWAPRRMDIPEFAFERFPFLSSYIPSRSVTECEIIYGALGNGPDTRCPTKRAFFFIRADEYLDTLEDQEFAEACKEKDAFGVKNLRRLKQKLRDRYAESQELDGGCASGARLPPVECLHEYMSPSEFAETLHKELVRAIDLDFANATFRPKNELDAEFVAHVAYAKPLVRVYHGQVSPRSPPPSLCIPSTTIAQPRHHVCVTPPSAPAHSLTACTRTRTRVYHGGRSMSSPPLKSSPSPAGSHPPRMRMTWAATGHLHQSLQTTRAHSLHQNRSSHCRSHAVRPAALSIHQMAACPMACAPPLLSSALRVAASPPRSPSGCCSTRARASSLCTLLGAQPTRPTTCHLCAAS